MNVSPRQTDLVKHIVGMIKEWVISDVMGKGGPGTYGALMGALRKMQNGTQMTMEQIACAVIDSSVIKSINMSDGVVLRFHKDSRISDNDPNIEVSLQRNCSSDHMSWGYNRSITIHLESTDGPSTQKVLHYIKAHGRSRRTVILSDKAFSLLQTMLVDEMNELKDILLL